MLDLSRIPYWFFQSYPSGHHALLPVRHHSDGPDRRSVLHRDPIVVADLYLDCDSTNHRLDH